MSALLPEAMEQHQAEVEEKVAKGQVRVVPWEELKKALPDKLKLSPIAMVPHKSRVWRAILDLSFILKLAEGEMVPSVNETSEKLPPLKPWINWATSSHD